MSSVRRTVLAFVRVCPPSGKFSLSGTLCRRSRSSSTLSHKTSKYDTAQPHSCLQPSHWSSASGGRGGNSSQDWLPLAQKGSCTSPLGSVVRIGAVAAAAVSSASENDSDLDPEDDLPPPTKKSPSELQVRLDACRHELRIFYRQMEHVKQMLTC